MHSPHRWTDRELRDRDNTAFALTAFCACVGALIWVLWVVPIAASVSAAEPAPLGNTVEVDLRAGERVGIWATGRSSWLGTMTCSLGGAEGGESLRYRGPQISWDDTLWWMTPRPGFVQRAQVVSGSPGIHTITCIDSLDTYEGEFLVAGDSFGSGSIGLGRTGSIDVSVGSLLAFGAVFCPPVVILIPAVILIRRLVMRRRRVRDMSRQSFPGTGAHNT